MVEESPLRDDDEWTAFGVRHAGGARAGDEPDEGDEVIAIELPAAPPDEVGAGVGVEEVR